MAAATTLHLGLGAIFLAVLLAVAVVLGSAGQRRQVVRSLAAVGARRIAGDPSSAELPASGVARLLRPMMPGLTAAARRALPADASRGVSGRLERAGNPYGWELDDVLAYKALLTVVLATFGVLLGHSSVGRLILFVPALGAAGFFLPDIWLYNMALKRQEQIQRTLADALDMLTISVEAGLAFDAALSQVARNTEGPLAAEFFRVLQEMQIGKGRAEAFRAILDRTDVGDLRTFVNAIVQADAFGVPIANVLRTQAKEMRQKRRQASEEKAQKVPVKIVVPLVLCVLPALFVVILGPGAIQIVKAFHGAG